MNPTAAPTISLAEVRRILADLFRPNPWIYWADFLGSLALGGLCFHLVGRVEPWSLAQAGLFVASAVLYYRAALFTHELVHLRDKSFRAFRVAWNVLCGIPFLMPSFMYYSHVDHHQRKHYGTSRDGEYLPLGATPPWHIFTYLLQPLIIPALAVVRFGLLAPLGWLSPEFRAWLHARASSLVMDPSYVRPLPSRQTLRIFRFQEAGCFAFIVGAATLIAAGWLPWTVVPQAYLTAVLVLYLNHVRTLGAHRYTNLGGEMTFVEQLLDSVNYPRWPLVSGLWAPVGLRFHALHHLCPSLPYHSLAAAHQRLLCELPADSPYRQTESSGLLVALGQLLHNARAAERRRSPAPAPHASRRRDFAGQGRMGMQ